MIQKENYKIAIFELLQILSPILLLFLLIAFAIIRETSYRQNLLHQKQQELPAKLAAWDKKKNEVEISDHRCNTDTSICEVILSNKQIVVLDCLSNECWIK